MENKGRITIKTKKEKKRIDTRVEEIENGFLIVRDYEWQDPKLGYQYETKKFFSEKNPLENTEKELAKVFK